MPIKKRKKECLAKFHENMCEQCKTKFLLEELEIHRIRRGCKGGTYEDHRNLKVLCKKCHRRIHEREFKHIGSKY